MICAQVASGSLLASGSSERFTGTTQRCSSPARRRRSSPRKRRFQISLEICHLRVYSKYVGTASARFLVHLPVKWRPISTITRDLSTGTKTIKCNLIWCSSTHYRIEHLTSISLVIVNYDLDLWTWPRYIGVAKNCQMLRSFLKDSIVFNIMNNWNGAPHFFVI